MTSSLVGSEMCIRDSTSSQVPENMMATLGSRGVELVVRTCGVGVESAGCLLYTSDAADDM
eukprot:11712476-Prorocentrum_lima.AAC.1